MASIYCRKKTHPEIVQLYGICGSCGKSSVVLVQLLIGRHLLRKKEKLQIKIINTQSVLLFLAGTARPGQDGEAGRDLGKIAINFFKEYFYSTYKYADFLQSFRANR